MQYFIQIRKKKIYVLFLDLLIRYMTRQVRKHISEKRKMILISH